MAVNFIEIIALDKKFAVGELLTIRESTSPQVEQSTWLIATLTRQLADKPTHKLDSSQTGQLADNKFFKAQY